MKKALSLLLAAVMALALCVTAFAGGDTGTRVYLTGDAADEVTGLTSGQRIDAGGSTTVRLNVQSDPGAEEYTVKLDGEALKADHSTAQYHVYSLPADKLTAKTATLSVNGGVSTQAASANTLTVTVGDTPYPVNLSGGSRDVKNLTELSLSITNADGGFKQIYISGEGIKLYASWSKRSGTMSGAENFVAVSDKGFTKSDMYIYKTPKKQTQDVYITYTVGNTPYYYKLTITCPAAEGYALGAGGFSMSDKEYSELKPGGTTDREGGNYNFTYADNVYSTWIKQENSAMPLMSQIGAAMAVYRDGSSLTSTSGNELSALAQPNWDTLVLASHRLYTTAQDGPFTTKLIVNRPGFYWFPVAFTYENTHLTGMLPMEARATAVAANDYLTAAEAAKASFTDNEAAAKLLADAITTVTAAKDNLTSAVYVGDNGYTYTEPDDTKLAAVNTARTYYGAPITGAALVEKELNILQDMAAIANATTLQAEKLEAYMKLMSTGVHAAVDIQSGEDRDAYQNMRQAKWNLLQAESVDALNGILDKFSLKHIGETEPEEPEVTLGDVDGDGKVTINDAGLIALYVNGYRTMNETQLKAADVTKSDGVTINDAGLIALYVNGFRSSLG
mgnify:FL=1